MNLETANYLNDGRTIQNMTGDHNIFTVKDDHIAFHEKYTDCGWITEHGRHTEGWIDDEWRFCYPVRFGSYEVCPHCRGEGTVVDPSVDCSGISFDDHDPHFQDDYMSGAFRITCTRCDGLRVVRPIILDEKITRWINELRRELMEDYREYRSEAMYGC